MNRLCLPLILAASVFAYDLGRAQDWPARPITMVVPYAAGGPTDSIGRLFAQQIGAQLKTQIVVENIVGAGGMTGASRVAQASPDGYRFLFSGSNMTFSQLLYKQPPFNSLTDFSPVSLLTHQSLILITRKDHPADSLHTFISGLKSGSNVNYGSAGVGSSSHLGCVMFNLAAGADVPHVPYRGMAFAMADLISGRIDYVCNLIQDALPQIQGGTAKPVAMLSRMRSPLLPNLETAQEQGLANLDAADWYGLFFPKNTPSPIVQKLNQAAAATMDLMPFRDRLNSLGVEIIAPQRRGPENLASFIKDEITRWAIPIKTSGVAEQ